MTAKQAGSPASIERYATGFINAAVAAFQIPGVSAEVLIEVVLNGDYDFDKDSELDLGVDGSMPTTYNVQPSVDLGSKMGRKKSGEGRVVASFKATLRGLETGR